MKKEKKRTKLSTTAKVINALFIMLAEGKYQGTKSRFRADTSNKKDLNTFNEVLRRLSAKEPILKISSELGISRNTIKSIKTREGL